MVIPPKGEQNEILERLKDQLSTASRSVRGAEKEISLLREYRTRLIADVVTGKLDVRKAAAQLLDEAALDDQSEPPIDEIEAEEPEDAITSEVEA